MGVCGIPTVKPKQGKLMYIGFILFGVLMSTLTFIPAFRRFFVVNSRYCSRNTSQGKCDTLVGHILLYRFFIGMMVFFLFLAIINCQLTVFTTFSHWLENGFWFIKFHLFCLCVLLSLLIPEGHLSNAIMHVGWIGSFIVMVIQAILIIDLAKALNGYWVERMELSERPKWWYFSMLFFTSLLYTLSLAFIVYFYATYTISKDCKTNLIFITTVVLLCTFASLLSIHPKVRETGLLQAGIVTSYSVYFGWTCMQHYPYSACNPSWNFLILTEFNFHIQLNMIFDTFVTFSLLVYSVLHEVSVQHLLTNINPCADCWNLQSQVENHPSTSEESEEKALVTSTYLMFYLFLLLICLHLLMVISNYYTPEGIVGTEDEVLETEYDKLIDMDEYVKSLSQWVASCLKMIVCVVFLLLYIWTILSPVVLPANK